MTDNNPDINKKEKVPPWKNPNWPYDRKTGLFKLHLTDEGLKKYKEETRKANAHLNIPEEGPYGISMTFKVIDLAPFEQYIIDDEPPWAITNDTKSINDDEWYPPFD
jgi:hypothetical protein